MSGGGISTTPGAGTGGSGRVGGGGGPCGACKFLRRKCVSGCIFAPYFDSEQGAAHFAAVHKVFGASNVSKLLLHIPAHKRLDAVVTVCYEAQERLRDPVHGCVANIFALQQQVVNLQAELSYLQAHLATMELPAPPPAPPLTSPPSPFSISDLPSSSSSTLPSSGDLSTLFDPLSAQPPPSWPFQHHQHQPPQQQPCTTARNLSDNPSGCGGGELQALARALLDRNRSAAGGSTPPVDIKATTRDL